MEDGGCVAHQRVRALGSMLNGLVGQDIFIVGSVQDVNSSGSSIKIKTTDNVTLNVSFDTNLDDMPSGWVQLWAKVVGPNALTAENMWQFIEEEGAAFDAATYNEAVKTFQDLKDTIHTFDSGSSSNGNGMDAMDMY